jgi:hypothetical protein
MTFVTKLGRFFVITCDYIPEEGLASGKHTKNNAETIIHSPALLIPAPSLQERVWSYRIFIET